MNKDKKIIIGLIIIIIILVVGGLAFIAGKNYKEKNELPVVGDNLPQENQLPNDTEKNCVVVDSPKQNDKVGNIVKVTGHVNGCDNWIANTGVAGEMVIKDDNGNILNDPNNAEDGNLNVSDWGKTYPDNFSGQIVIVKQPETKFGLLIITNENQSDNFSLTRKMEIKLDLSNIKITKISTTLPQYIGGQSGWPPVVQESAERYSCTIGSVGMGVKTVTTERTINGKTYCVSLAEEGAMGKIYKTYTYKTFGVQGTSKTMTFTLGYQECGVWRGDGTTKYSDCQAVQLNFNSKLDAIVNSLM